MHDSADAEPDGSLSSALSGTTACGDVGDAGAAAHSHPGKEGPTDADSEVLRRASAPGRDSGISEPGFGERTDGHSEVLSLANGATSANGRASESKETPETPPELPQTEYSRTRKAGILALLTLWGFVGNTSSTVLLPALPLVQADLSTSQQAVNASVAVATAVNGIVPLLWSALSDTLGRRRTFLVAGPIFVLASAAGYFVPNIAVFFVVRIVQQAAASAALSTGSGTIADLYGGGQLSNALGIFYLGFTTGTTIGPAFGGLITEASSWRYCFVFAAALGLAWFVPSAVFLPETGAKKGRTRARDALLRPLVSLGYNRYPFVISNVLVMALSFMELYTMSVTIPRDFPTIYGFSTAQAGFVQLTAGVGMLAGTYASGRYSDRTYRLWKQRRGGVIVPEDRLRATIPAIFVLVAGSLLLGWTLAFATGWPASAAGAVVLGIGIMGFSTASSAFLIQIFPGSASSIIASANVLRYTLAGIGPLVVAPLQAAVGPGWLWTILAAVNVAAYLGLLLVALRGTGYRLGMEPWKSSPGAGEQLAAIGRSSK
ncbi:major facilitator superfamily domain-containing protein [Hyaloraphidium curvatum]|nr:major facilitator superfamily domain-containing protein [Hyaloraphidium curvatum]